MITAVKDNAETFYAFNEAGKNLEVAKYEEKIAQNYVNYLKLAIARTEEIPGTTIDDIKGTKEKLKKAKEDLSSKTQAR